MSKTSQTSPTSVPDSKTVAEGQLSDEQLAEVAGGITIIGGRDIVSPRDAAASPRDAALGGPDTKAPTKSQIIGVLIGL
jgi:hypothetical protein